MYLSQQNNFRAVETQSEAQNNTRRTYYYVLQIGRIDSISVATPQSSLRIQSFRINQEAWMRSWLAVIAWTHIGSS